MSIWVVFFVAIGLSMDTFAVSIVLGSSAQKIRGVAVIWIGFIFAFTQMMMPVLGWLLVWNFRVYIESFDHWIAFLLLSMIGIKMMFEANNSDCDKKPLVLTVRRVFVLSIATSIDAFAVGMSFASLNYSLLFCVLVIGVVTFLVSVIGTFIGRLCCCQIGRPAEFVGGLILVGLGIRILMEHLRL